MSFVSACSTTISKPVFVCPTVKEYTKEFREKAVSELDLLPVPSSIEEMIKDYSVLRKQVKICNGE